MTNKDTILKTVDFIEDNLKNDISVMDIAKEGCYSLYHFIRLFQSITGYSPNQYLLYRRLSEAARLLQNSDHKILDVAYEYQFGSHESFTRAFRKKFGISPSDIKAGHSSTSLSLVQRITPDYIYQSEKVRNQPPEVVELSRRTLAGISFFLSDNTKINDLSKEWGQFMREASGIDNKVTPDKYYQVQFWSENQDLGGLYFYIGVEVECADEVDPQFVVKIIPKGKYLKFIHKGLANKVGYTYKYIYNQYLPTTNYKLNRPFNFELYGEKCLGPYNENSESEIYIPVE